MQPLTGVTVMDFSTLLPGPLASLILAEAGAEVVKVERPGAGDPMRTFGPAQAGTTPEFMLLNRGKRSVALDLKAAGARERLTPLIKRADVLIEQFRPGVMRRLGLDYEQLRALNPGIIYCSLTGYGQTGPKSMLAGHDLNYLAETGVLALSSDGRGAPVIPPALIADIGAGAFPLVMNVLLALRQRETTGEGCYLDVSMTDNLFTMVLGAQSLADSSGRSPRPGGELLTGGSPRYQIYPTADGKYLAAAPLEQKFWDNFCDTIELDPALRDDRLDPAATKAAVKSIIQSRPASEWARRFAGIDACVCEVADIASAMKDPQFLQRGLFASRVGRDAASLTAVVMPISTEFRQAPGLRSFPDLGEANKDYLDQEEGGCAQ